MRNVRYVVDMQLITEECCDCGMAFAMTNDFYERRRKDHDDFYCPSGHGQHYTGKTEEQKLKERLEQEQQRVVKLELKAGNISKNYSRMRKRIANGVCPCCNRTFQNLMNHMKNEHPDFSDSKKLKTLRLMFGLTQTALEEETGVKSAYISNYENDRPGSEHVKDRLEGWINSQAG